MTQPNVLLNLTARLAKNYAIELDYHYENKDFEHLSEEIETLGLAKLALASHGYAPIGVVDHVIARFNQSNPVK